MNGKLNWIEILKLAGGAIAALAALFEYSLHSEQEHRDRILQTMQLVQGDAVNRLHDNLQHLIVPFYPADGAGKAYWDHYADSDPSARVQFIRDNVIARDDNDQRFKSVIAFFDVVYDFGKANPCGWTVMRSAFQANAGDFEYYFRDYLAPYAARQHESEQQLTRSIYALIYDVAPGEQESCGLKRPASLITRAAFWIETHFFR